MSTIANTQQQTLSTKSVLQPFALLGVPQIAYCLATISLLTSQHPTHIDAATTITMLVLITVHIIGVTYHNRKETTSKNHPAGNMAKTIFILGSAWSIGTILAIYLGLVDVTTAYGLIGFTALLSVFHSYLSNRQPAY